MEAQLKHQGLPAQLSFKVNVSLRGISHKLLASEKNMRRENVY